MLRTPLHELCLQIKVSSLGTIWEFSSRAIEPPNQEMCERAILELTQLRALDVMK